MDPGLSTGKYGDCNTGASQVRNTGLASRCVSTWGAEDMIGNLWEMTSEWNAGSTTAADNPPWGVSQWLGSTFGGDGLWNIGNVVLEMSDSEGASHGIPGFAMRGASSFGGPLAGVFALSYAYAPSSYSAENGFRCVLAR
jgi:formylglycine-generating enzyme required for sulfatase activity